jgi:hypothetical protein
MKHIHLKCGLVIGNRRYALEKILVAVKVHFLYVLAVVELVFKIILQ